MGLWFLVEVLVNVHREYRSIASILAHSRTMLYRALRDITDKRPVGDTVDELVRWVRRNDLSVDQRGVAPFGYVIDGDEAFAFCGTDGVVAVVEM